MDAFLEEARARRSDRRLTVTREARRALSSYAWPGNVRELRAEVFRWVVFCDDRVDLSDLAPEIRAPGGRARAAPVRRTATAQTLAEAVEAAERAAIGSTMAAEKGNRSRAARALGIDRNTLKRKLARYGIEGGSEDEP